MYQRPASIPISNHFHSARLPTPNGYEMYDTNVYVTSSLEMLSYVCVLNLYASDISVEKLFVGVHSFS